jgi:O-antigen/teichoic acid export membrane protein
MITDSSSAGKRDVVAIGVAPAETAAQVHSNKEIDSNEKHFRTDHLLTNLKGRAVSSAFITIAAQGAQFVLSLGSIMVLARLLTPKDFGLFAMVTTVMGFLRVFKDAGLSTATVQREKITHAQISNLFWINIAMSGTAANWLFASQGRGKDWLFAGSLLSGIAVASFVAGLPFGPVGVAIAYSAGGLLVGLPVHFYFAGRQGPVTTADLWIVIFQYLPLWQLSAARPG